MLRSAKDLFYGKRGSNILVPEGWDLTAAFDKADVLYLIE